jgi:hypothetical protein
VNPRLLMEWLSSILTTYMMEKLIAECLLCRRRYFSGVFANRAKYPNRLPLEPQPLASCGR